MAVIIPTDLSDEAVSWLSVEVGEHDLTCTIRLAGELDLAGRQATQRAVQKALRRGPERLVLDLSQLSFMDSTGVHLALELFDRAAMQGYRLVIVPGPACTQRVFDACGLTACVPFVAGV